MKWLLVFMTFTLQEDGSMVGGVHGTMPFKTEAACNIAGRDFRTLYPQIPTNYDSLTVCVPEEAFAVGPTINGAIVAEVPLADDPARSSRK